MKCLGCCQLATAAFCSFHERASEAVTCSAAICITLQRRSFLERLAPFSNLIFPSFPFMFSLLPQSVPNQSTRLPLVAAGSRNEPKHPGQVPEPGLDHTQVALVGRLSREREQNMDTFTMSIRLADAFRPPLLNGSRAQRRVRPPALLLSTQTSDIEYQNCQDCSGRACHLRTSGLCVDGSSSVRPRAVSAAHKPSAAQHFPGIIEP